MSETARRAQSYYQRILFMLRKLYRKMTIGYFVILFYRICFYLLFIPRFFWRAVLERLPENTDHSCEGTSDQLDVTCSTSSDNYQNLEMDEFYCEYDSTWETNSSKTKETSRQRRHRSFRFERFREASRDMQNYRHDYPETYSRNRQENATPNLDFYLGKRRSLPDNCSIEEFHNNWFGDYQRLEDVHSFIQWLFPLQEPGVNLQAFEITKEEIKAFQKNQKAKENLLTSYKLMLDFYGLQLSNETTGEVKKSPMWRDRFNNLNRNTHNNLRITRILKCLGTLGYPHYQAPLVHFFLEETLVNQNLPNVKESVLNYFMFTVLDKMKRRELIQYAYRHFDECEFVWCPKKIQMEWNEGKENKAVATCHQNTEPRSTDEEEIMNYDNEYQADVCFKQARAVYQTSHQSREPEQMHTSDEEENNEAEDNANFTQESTVHKISQHGQQAQKFSYEEEENNEAEDNANFTQESTVHKISQHRQQAQKFSYEKEENNEAEDNANFTQESTVHKISQHGQQAQKFSYEKEENNEAEDNANFTQESTVHKISQHGEQAQKFSYDEEENNEAEDNANFTQESTVHKISQHGEQAQKLSYDEEENNEDQAKGDLGCSPNNTDSPGATVNLSVSSTDNGQSTAGKDTDLTTNLYEEQASKYENISGQVHSPENHSMDPTDSNVNPSDSSTNSSQKSDG